jgi:hypothetical protein
MTSYNITLPPTGEVPAGNPKEASGPFWWTSDNIVVISSEQGTVSRYALPKGKPRLTCHPMTGGRASLAIGSWSAVTVRVVGPVKTIQALQEAVL